MKIVIIAGFFPYPAHFGGAYDVLERVKGLHSLGYEVDLVCTCKVIPDSEQLQYLQHYVNQLFVLPRKNKVIHLFSFKSFSFISSRGLTSKKSANSITLLLIGTNLSDKIFES